MHTFDIDDVEAANTVLRAQYTSMRLTSSDERPALRIEQRQLGSVGLHRFAFGMTADVEGEPLGYAWIGRIEAGTVSYGSDTTHRAGDVVLAARPDESWRASLDDLHGNWALLDPAELSEVAQPEHPDRPVRFTGFAPTSDAAARRWCEALTFVRALAAEPADSLVAAAGARLLLATALATIPNDAQLHPGATDRRDAHSDTLRRAIAFVETNPHRPITTAEIARAAHVTVRAVQFAFRRQLDTTPMAYLRRVRLDRARLDLRDSDAVSTTVGAVSARWGFLSASQFAAKYKAVYGESPSVTLQR